MKLSADSVSRVRRIMPQEPSNRTDVFTRDWPQKVDPASYIGRQERQTDVADAQRLARLAAMLDHETPPWADGVVPFLGHWLFFQPRVLRSQIGPDGHPLRDGDGLLPAVALPRRMWAGSRVRFLRELPVGAPLTRISTVVDVSSKSGRTGWLLFVTLRHEIVSVGGETAIVEDQDIVYREAAMPGAPVEPRAFDSGQSDPITRVVHPDPILLFMFSALTLNGHRIHYDLPYCREAEGYSNLVVHGPLIATLLMDHLLCHRPMARVSAFSFKAVGPSFAGEPLHLGLSEVDETTLRLRAVGPAGPAVIATAELA